MTTEFHFDDLDLREEPASGLTRDVAFISTQATAKCCPTSDSCCFCSTTIC